MPPINDLTGRTFGRLLALEIVGQAQKGKDMLWRCRCSCLEQKELVVKSGSLVTGNTRSCGCLWKEHILVSGKKNRRHGHNVGKRETRTYSSWSRLKSRCLNPKDPHYRTYGAKGISVCERWRFSFENFLEDMGERPPGRTIDRINPYGNYEPGNCRWATPLEQRHNQRAKI